MLFLSSSHLWFTGDLIHKEFASSVPVLIH